MQDLTLIVALSAVVWYLTDKAKGLWEALKCGRYLTIACAAILSFGVTFAFGLDLICAVNLVCETSIAGQILTALVLMSGSSAVAEILERISKK